MNLAFSQAKKNLLLIKVLNTDILQTKILKKTDKIFSQSILFFFNFIILL
jgi:hypothetical protein